MIGVMFVDKVVVVVCLVSGWVVQIVVSVCRDIVLSRLS